jgi:O-antigen/teichoic acid export membrane protein
MLATAIAKPISIIKGQFQGSSLKARCARGAVAVGFGMMTWRGLRFVRNVFLTRLLAAADLGLMAIVMAAYTVFESLTDVGVKQSVIHNKAGATDEYLNVTWWFQTVRGLGLFTVAFLAAPLVCRFYQMPELLWLLRVTFIAMLFEGLQSPRVFVLEKEFKFGKSMVFMQSGRVVGTILTIVLAFYIRNVWVMVIGLLTSAVIRLFLSYIFCAFVPSFKIDSKCFGDLKKFARGMFGLSMLTMVAMQTDVLMLGKLVSVGDLGLYSMALSLSQQPVGILYQILSPVLLPAFAEKQDDKQALCRAIFKTSRILVILGVPITAFMVFCSSSLLSLVYTVKYAAVAIPFGILCITMLVRTQGSVLSLVYQAIGKPYLHRRYTTLLAILIVCLMYPGIKLYGLTGAALVLFVGHTIAVWMQLVWMREPIGIRLKNYVKCWLPGLWLVMIISAPVALLHLFEMRTLALDLATGGLACLIACIVGVYLLRHQLGLGLKA